MDPAPDVEAEAARTLATIADEVSQCRACPRLVEWRERVAREKRAAYADQEYWGRGVPGWGDPLASVAVVGLAPAAHGANRTGRMFCGDRSGEWLYRALWRAGFASQPETTSRDDDMVLSDVWITSPVHCAPPDNKPTIVERDTCVGFLSRELAALPRLSVVVALGGARVGGGSPRHLGSVVGVRRAVAVDEQDLGDRGELVSDGVEDRLARLSDRLDAAEQTMLPPPER